MLRGPKGLTPWVDLSPVSLPNMNNRPGLTVYIDSGAGNLFRVRAR